MEGLEMDELGTEGLDPDGLGIDGLIEAAETDPSLYLLLTS